MKTISFKVGRYRIEKVVTHIFLLLAVVLVSCHETKKMQQVSTYDCNVLYKNMDMCELLKALRDSSTQFMQMNNHSCFENIVNRLSIATNIRPQWDCSFAGCNYLSYSLDKSIFKIDLLKWMQYYECPGTDTFRASTQGNFTVGEMQIIKGRSYSSNKIDTMILYSRHSQ